MNAQIQANRAPNVVLIVADDMGWGDLGCNGATAIPTPNMDRVSAQGMRFTDAHSSSAVCTPSRYSIMTGRYAWRGPLKRFVLKGHGPAIIEPDRATIASVLHDSGYATGAFGKWHLGLGWKWKDGHVETAFGPDARLYADEERDYGHGIDYEQPFTGGPIELGFERFFGISGSLDMPPYCFLSQDHTVGIPTQPKTDYITSQRPGLQTEGWRDDQVDMRFTEAAISWLQERSADQRPFFLYLTPAAPHRPCVPPEQFKGLSQAGARGDAVCLIDWIVGEIDAALDELGETENTIFIVTSDNGAPTKYPEDGDTVHHRPNGPYRGQKGDIWDGGHREPLLVRWPAHVRAGAVSDDLVCLTDIFSTVLDAVGLTAHQDFGEDSVSAMDTLHETASADTQRAVVHHSMSGRFAIRMGRWKAEFCTGSGAGFSDPAGDPFDADHPVGQLYDLIDDPYEENDLWATRPDIVAEAYERLQSICGDETSGLPFAVAIP